MKKYTLKTVEEYYKENPNDLYDEDYKIPFDIKSLDDLIKIKRDSKIKKFNDNNSSNNGNALTTKMDFQNLIFII